jgi:hypothetical protein
MNFKVLTELHWQISFWIPRNLEFLAHYFQHEIILSCVILYPRTSPMIFVRSTSSSALEDDSFIVLIVSLYVKAGEGTSGSWSAIPCYFLMMGSDTPILLLRTDILASTDCPTKLPQSDRKRVICSYFGQYSLSSPGIGPVMII